MSEKTHWKQLVNLDYIGAYSLQGQDLTVEIVKVEVKRVKGENGKEEDCTVASLKGQKPFIVNRTNAKIITKIHSSPYIQDWEGKKITLYPTTTKVAGETVECLRVRPIAPKQETFDCEIAADEAKLRECKTLNELKDTFQNLRHRSNSRITAVKDELKAVLR